MTRKQHKSKKASIAFDSIGEELHHDESNWLISYADLMTLLMGFFILMYSMSITDDEKFNAVSKQVAQYFGGPLEVDPRIKDVEARVENVLKSNELEKFAHIENKNGKIYIKFANEILFKSGSPYLTSKAKEAINSVGKVLAEITGVEEIRVEGHTDSVPIKSKYYPSNWELSSARASTIVRYFNRQGVDGKVLRAVGYAGQKPLMPNKAEDGSYIKNNLRINRRVEVEVKLARNTNIKKFEKKSMFSFMQKNIGAKGDRQVSSENKNGPKAVTDLSAGDIEKRYKEAQEQLDLTNTKLRKVQSLKKKEDKRLKMIKKIKELENKTKKSQEELRSLVQ